MLTLAQARQRRSISQKQLAVLLGIKQSTVSRWERGLAQPNPGNLNKLCQILAVASKDIAFEKTPEEGRTSGEEMRRQIEAHDESMGYVDSTWLRGGRYDIDPASHETS